MLSRHGCAYHVDTWDVLGRLSGTFLISRDIRGHALEHYDKSLHPVTVDISSMAVYWYCPYCRDRLID